PARRGSVNRAPPPRVPTRGGVLRLCLQVPTRPTRRPNVPDFGSALRTHGAVVWLCPEVRSLRLGLRYGRAPYRIVVRAQSGRQLGARTRMERRQLWTGPQLIRPRRPTSAIQAR